MRKLAFLLSCVASIGYGRRLHERLPGQKPLNNLDAFAALHALAASQGSQLARLLLAYSSGAAFNRAAGGASAHFLVHNPSSSTLRQVSPPFRERGTGNVLMAKPKPKKKRMNRLQVQSAGPLNAPSEAELERAEERDRVPAQVVLQRLSEVPIFGVKSRSKRKDLNLTAEGWLLEDDGMVVYYMDPLECDNASFLVRQTMMNNTEKNYSESQLIADIESGLQTLDQIIFEENVILKPSVRAIREVAQCPKRRALVDDIRMPIFCLDGLMTTDQKTGRMEMPVFFTMEKCLGMSRQVIPDAEEKVMIGDLSVFLANMMNGPAGPLRDAFFLPDDESLMRELKIREDEAGLAKDRLIGKSGLNLPGLREGAVEALGAAEKFRKDLFGI